MRAESKIKTKEELVEIRKKFAERNKTVVFTNGCFDLLHRGHVEYLEKASEFGDLLIVGLNSDKSVTRLKGKGRPLINQEDRALILAALESINFVSIFYEDTPYQLIKSLQPDVLVKGGDYKPDEIVGGDIVEKKRGKVITIPLTLGRSTSDLIMQLKTLIDNGTFSNQEMNQ
jgi:D-beta-D-heptose 7-phosphate kinase/D-beta-D-heptose 1-phosphate adenosyltransferase